ncbi:hypothetical protein PC9H_009198 [Pleurotus ostreatus]|uniref:Uncharacterized protein n=1 Tax=Pleurotus ostreatus TaxID=5322 RepID=A0A8H6ZSQ4_PLEOS|nr:uncharacterized protein PC9H_009198 [Pleurotus ostreatus]KAF7426829.1 hypothetical protein PC9H_009198 [Pleurotus ostreatus]
MDAGLVTRLRDPSIDLAKRYRQFMAKRPDLTSTSTATRFNGHVTQLKVWIGRLEAIKAPWPDILFAFTQVQRHYLELEAFLEYMEVRQPLMNSEEYGKILLPAALLIGAVTNTVVVVEEFAKAGVPVWLIRPIEQFTDDTRIDAVTNPYPPEALDIELAPWRGHKTLVWNRAADHPQRHDNLMLFAREFLSYTDFGRTSTIRDTIERPPAVPSLGNDYSATAGPSRAVEAAKPPPGRKQKPHYPPHPPKPRINLHPHDINHFKPNPNAMAPIMMEAWVHGLSTVTVTKEKVSMNFAEGDNGYIFPPISVFIPFQVDGNLKPRHLKLLHAYLTHSDILILRLSPRNNPTSLLRGNWDLLLGPERSNPTSIPPSTTSTATADDEPKAKKTKVEKLVKRRQNLQTILAEWTNEYDVESNARNESLAWASEQLPKDRWPHDRVVERILYEINEINFRWEFRMLDRKMVNPNISYVAHEDLITRCFPSSSFKGEGGADHTSVKYTTAWSGLSSPDDKERRQYVLALCRVIAHWHRCPDAINKALKCAESDVDFLAVEKLCASFYCKSFFYYFARAPSVPHRTAIDPEIYLMP